jgi:hypothetical protein
VVALILVAILAFAAYKVLNSTAFIDHYCVADEQTLMLGVTSGPGADVHLSDLVETATTVTVTVIAVYFSPPLPQSGVGYLYVVEAHLAQPLGNRLVIDSSTGMTVARIPCPLPSSS